MDWKLDPGTKYNNIPGTFASRVAALDAQTRTVALERPLPWNLFDDMEPGAPRCAALRAVLYCALLHCAALRRRGPPAEHKAAAAAGAARWALAPQRLR